MSQTIAVTGATGHLGQLVIDELLQRVPADQVVAVVRNAEKAQPIADKGVEIRVAGLRRSRGSRGGAAGRRPGPR